MPFTTTAVSSRSPRYLGKITPLEGSPTWCPARPMRWRPRATDVGLSTWMTRSTAPMSMPSSSELVATRAGRRPAFSSSSISRRCSLAMLPWWARTSSSPASSFRRWASRSARRRLLVNTMVLRCSRISCRIRGWIAGQMLVRISPPSTGPPGCSSIGRTSPSLAMSSTGTTTWISSGLRVPASTMRHLAAVTDAAEEAGDGLERSLRGAEADALDGGRGRRAPQVLEALQAQREVGAALGAGDRVDLVDDHVLDAPQDLASLAGQQEVEALGGRDEDVRRVADEVAALVRGGVAGPGGDADARRRVAQAGGLEGDARERGAQVPLHVVGQGLERADIEDADGAGLFPGGRRPGVLNQPIEAPQERGEGLAAAGRSVDQRVVTAGDRSPALCLGRRRGLERRLEPGPDGGPERGKRIGQDRDHGTPSIGARSISHKRSICAFGSATRPRAAIFTSSERFRVAAPSRPS